MNPAPTVVGVDSFALDEKLVRVKELTFTAAAVKTSNATMLQLVDAAGAGRVHIFHGAVLEVLGGTANYDQNQDFTVNYQAAGGGATVSTTLANLMNGAASGTLSTLKPIVTDYTPEANQALVLKSSASPYNAAGNRQLKVTVWYSTVTVE